MTFSPCFSRVLLKKIYCFKVVLLLCGFSKLMNACYRIIFGCTISDVPKLETGNGLMVKVGPKLELCS